MMYARVLRADLWESSTFTSEEISRPSWDAIEAAVKRLDGKRRTLVTIAAEAEAHMGIGGGKEDQYVVYATYDNYNFRTLLSADPSEARVGLFIGGQLGDYPKNIVVSLASALAAAKAFAECGEIDDALKWRNK